LVSPIAEGVSVTSAPKQPIHLISNAHLDPVWLWPWEEGAAEAVSTFRTAADLCEQDEHFVFNHNEVILYKWVQSYEPELFRRIQKLVKQGRWHIMGGWYLQPDCNMPSGESFVRQILTGRAYFQKYFGVQPTTAINFDPFGHTRGLVQIMAKSGFDSYLFGRPTPDCLELPGEDFVWVGYDGSEILATRFAGWYHTPLGRAAETIQDRMAEHAESRPVLAVLWGVGNHGGGPSRVDLSDVNKLIDKRSDLAIRHSTPEAYFADLRRHCPDLPRHERDINPWAIGCYTSQVQIKQKHRELENEIYALEKMATAASQQGLLKYPEEALAEAMEDLLYGEFHDILPGSSIEPVEEASLRCLDHGLEIVSRERMKTFFALATGQKRATRDAIPVLVCNHHPFRTRTLIECEFNLPDFHSKEKFTDIGVYHRGRLLPCQVEKELSHCPVEWRKRIVFWADLDPGVVNRFDCQLNVIQSKPPVKLKERNGKIRFKTDAIEVVINAKTGLLDKYRVDGCDLLQPDSMEPLVMADTADSWVMFANSFPKIVGRFQLVSAKEAAAISATQGRTLPPVRVIEDGPARSVVEAILKYNRSVICQRYMLPKVGTEVDVETIVYWHEKDKMLKIAVPTTIRSGRFLGQVAYGVEELPSDGSEAVFQKWSAVVDDERNIALTSINRGIYAGDFQKGTMRLSLLRSSAYAGHPDAEGDLIGIPQDRYSPRMDQGRRRFRFSLNAGKARKRLEAIDREALVKNEFPFALSFYPSGKGKLPKALAVLNDKVVQITAIKQAARGHDLILRLYEPTGKKRSTVLSLPLHNKKIQVELRPFEIKTLRVRGRDGKITEVDLLERSNTRKVSHANHRL